jgi:ATP-binding cassette subfamily B (MDR/TAP) protein 9
MVKGIGFFIFMFGISWKLTLVTIMGFPFIAVISKVYGEYYKVHARTSKHTLKWTKTQTSLVFPNKCPQPIY